MMSSSNQRPANRGFRSVLRCAISHYRQFPLAVCTRTTTLQAVRTNRRFTSSSSDEFVDKSTGTEPQKTSPKPRSVAICTTGQEPEIKASRAARSE